MQTHQKMILKEQNAMKCNTVCIQTFPKMNDKDYNLSHMESLFREALNEHPDTDLVVFSELATSGYQCGENFKELAEVIDKSGTSIKHMAKLAKETNTFIIFGMPEKDPVNPDILYNSQVFLNNNGDIIGQYRKIHLFDSEKKIFTPGNEFKVFDTAIGKIGLFICYDAFFPEAARILALKGANLLVNSTNWESPYSYDMDMVMTARALENTVYLACSNRIGSDTTLSFFGHSRILNPLGQVISDVKGEIEGYTYASLDYDKATQMKKDYYTMLTERRPELYMELVQ